MRISRGLGILVMKAMGSNPLDGSPCRQAEHDDRILQPPGKNKGPMSQHSMKTESNGDPAKEIIEGGKEVEVIHMVRY